VHGKVIIAILVADTLTKKAAGRTGKHLKGSKLWKGEIVCIDCTSPGQPLLFFECCEEDSDGPYPMQVSDFLKFWDRPMGRLPRGGALFPRQTDGV
jgi:hypothetical protein